MANSTPLDPRSVPLTLWRIAPDVDNTLPAVPHILVEIGDEDIQRCVLGGMEQILDITKHVKYYRAGIQLGMVASGATWAFVFTEQGFEARLCFTSKDMLKMVMNDERNIPRLMAQLAVLLNVITDIFPTVGLTTTND